MLLDGALHHVHVRACDGADNCSPSAHQGPFLIDTVAPTLVTGLTSTSHTVSTPSNLEELTMVWTPATDAASGVAGYAFTVDGNPAGTCSQTQNLGAVSTVTTAPLVSGSWYFHICTLDVAGNWSAAVASAGPFQIDLIPPQVAELRTVPHTGDPQLQPGETTSTSITRLIPAFDEPMVGEIEIENYHLFASGPDGVVDSSGCGAASGDDVVVTLGPPDFLPVGESPALSVGSPRSLPAGIYRMVVCSVPGLTDLAGNVPRRRWRRRGRRRVPARLRGRCDESAAQSELRHLARRVGERHTRQSGTRPRRLGFRVELRVGHLPEQSGDTDDPGPVPHRHFRRPIW